MGDKNFLYEKENYMRELLIGEVNAKLEEMGQLDVNDTKYGAAVTNVKNLMESAVKFEQVDVEWSKLELLKEQEKLKTLQEEEKAKQAALEREDRLKQQEKEAEEKKQQIELEQKRQKSERRRGWCQLGIVIVGTVAGIILPIWGTIVDHHDEEEGRITTSHSGKKHRDNLYTKK